MDNPYKRGFDRRNRDTIGVPAYDAGTRTFSLSVKAGESYFGFWADGKRHNKYSTESIVWPIAAETYYFYFDINGDLQYITAPSMTEEIFLKSAICGLVYWNGTEIIVQANDEQHGVRVNPPFHFSHHLTTGSLWSMGGDVTGIVAGNSTYTGIATVVSLDEDIVNITNSTTTHPFIYRDGADGVWKQTIADNNIGHIVSGDTFISWNEWTGATWQLTESSTSTDFIIYYFLWTNDSVYPIKKVIGQQTYASRNAAREALLTEIGKIDLQGLPSTEAYPMFAYIAKRDNTIESDGDGNTYVDLRGKLIFNAS